MQMLQKMKEAAKKGKLKAFFDIDGVLAELEFVPGGIKNKTGIYGNQRPIKTVIAFMESLQQLGGEVYALSLCNYNAQKEEKIEWLTKYIPFLKKENMVLIAKKEPDAPQMDKHLLKPHYIQKILKPNDTVYFVDDNHENLRGMHDALPFLNCVHISQFIK